MRCMDYRYAHMHAPPPRTHTHSLSLYCLSLYLSCHTTLPTFVIPMHFSNKSYVPYSPLLLKRIIYCNTQSIHPVACYSRLSLLTLLVSSHFNLVNLIIPWASSQSMSSDTDEVRTLLMVLIPKVIESQDIFHSQVGDPPGLGNIY